MIATEAGVDSIDVLESIGEPRGRQIIRSKPPAEIGERSDDRRKCDANQCESCQRAGLAEALPHGFSWGSRDVRHLQLARQRKVRTSDTTRYRSDGSCTKGMTLSVTATMSSPKSLPRSRSNACAKTDQCPESPKL